VQCRRLDGTNKSSELVKLIRKLRWIGLEAEAQRVQIAVRSGVTGE
jgi:hypothetical protein